MERFAGLNVCGFNSLEYFAEMLSHCLGQECLLFSIIKERHMHSWKNFHATLENRKQHKHLTQQIFAHLQHITMISNSSPAIL